MFDLHYYLESKYSYTETPKEFIRKVVIEKIPRHVEQFLRRFFSKCFGMQHQIIESKDFEIDIALFEFKNLKLVAEVKWKTRISSKEIKEIEKSLKDLSAKNFLSFQKRKSLKKPENIEVWDVKDLLALARESWKNKIFYFLFRLPFFRFFFFESARSLKGYATGFLISSQILSGSQTPIEP